MFCAWWVGTQNSVCMCALASLREGILAVCVTVSRVEKRQNVVARWDEIWTLWLGKAFWSWSDYVTLITQASSSCREIGRGGIRTWILHEEGFIFIFMLNLGNTYLFLREFWCTCNIEDIKMSQNFESWQNYYLVKSLFIAKQDLYTHSRVHLEKAAWALWA